MASESCPLKTQRAWQRFLETSTNDEAWVKTCTMTSCDDAVGSLVSRLQTDVLNVLDACGEDIANNPPIARCTARLRGFLPAWQRQHERGSYGFAQPNAEYFAAQIAPDKPPGMMDPPPAILTALPERRAIEAVARDNGWPYLTHDSCLGEERTFVTVSDPDGRFDQWFLFAVGADADRVKTGSVMSFLAVQKKDASGHELARVRVHFRDYLLAQADGGWTLSLPELHDAKCAGCHTNGPRALLPTHGAMVDSAPIRGESGYGETPAASDIGFTRLSALNEQLLAYGLPDWAETLDLTQRGPMLGESLGCTSCHDDVTRGALTVLVDEDTIKRKMIDELSMRSFLPGQSIPDDDAIALLDRERTNEPPLSAAEQAALEAARAEHQADYEALSASRFPTFQAWMLAVPCE